MRTLKSQHLPYNNVYLFSLVLFTPFFVLFFDLLLFASIIVPFINLSDRRGLLMKVLGVSGSPVENSNADRIVKMILEASGLDTEFIKLTDYVSAPCRACLGCRNTNSCEIRDDGVVLSDKAKNADAIVIGGYTPYSYGEEATPESVGINTF
jgi:hypothetical protein